MGGPNYLGRSGKPKSTMGVLLLMSKVIFLLQQGKTEEAQNQYEVGFSYCLKDTNRYLSKVISHDVTQILQFKKALQQELFVVVGEVSRRDIEQYYQELLQQLDMTAFVSQLAKSACLYVEDEHASKEPVSLMDIIRVLVGIYLLGRVGDIQKAQTKYAEYFDTQKDATQKIQAIAEDDWASFSIFGSTVYEWLFQTGRARHKGLMNLNTVIGSFKDLLEDLEMIDFHESIVRMASEEH